MTPAWDIPTRPRHARYRLDTCVWEITRACNFSCEHCGSSAGIARSDELSTAEALDVADQIAELGCKRVVLIGGEVFVRDDWDSIARRLVDGGVETSLITNGSCFSEHVWACLHAAGVASVAVSVDGNRIHHDELRMAGSYDACMEAFAQAKRQGVPVAAITVLNARNAADLPELYDELASRGVDAWQVQLCSPFGNARHGEGLMPDIGQVRTAVAFIAERNREVQRPGGSGEAPRIFAADNIGYHNDDEGVIRGYMGRCFRGCAAGVSVLGIDSAGTVRGCESLYDPAFDEGNVRDRTLRSIWESPDSFAYNRRFAREQLTGACALCCYGNDCRGGCRSLNHFTTGRLYEAPLCLRINRPRGN